MLSIKLGNRLYKSMDNSVEWCKFIILFEENSVYYIIPCRDLYDFNENLFAISCKNARIVECLEKYDEKWISKSVE